MSRFLLSALSVFVLVASALFTPVTASARRCPVRNPSTLLSLYRNSEFIYSATFDKVEAGEPIQTSEDYKVLPIKKYFTVSSTLKGESRKFIVLDDTEYRYEPRAVEREISDQAEVSSETGEVSSDSEDKDHDADETQVMELESIEGSPYRSAKPGDQVLLFLNRGADDGESASEASGVPAQDESSSRKEDKQEQFALSDEPFGMKVMTPDAIAVYEARIKELNGIFASKEPTHAQVVAWLVRCAENPSTRWEGTFELAESFRRVEWEAERAKEIQKEGQEEVKEIDAAEKFETGDTRFAQTLSDAQKQALTNILLDSDKSVRYGNTSGYRELVDLVGRWGNSAVAFGLMDRLMPQQGSMSSDVMSAISSILNDEELSAIYSRYSDIQWPADDEVVEEEETAEEPDVDSAEEPSAIEPSVSSIPENSAESGAFVEDETVTDDLASDVSKSKTAKQTYGEARSELVMRFKERAAQIAAKEREKKRAKLNP